MKNIARYMLFGLVGTMTIGTPNLAYGSKSLQDKVLVTGEATIKKDEIKATEIDFKNQSTINSLGKGRFFLGDFKLKDNETDNIKVSFKGRNFKNIERVRLQSEGANKSFSLYSSKDQVTVSSDYKTLNLEIDDSIKKEIYGDFVDSNGYYKNPKNTGRYYFYIDTLEEVKDASNNISYKRESHKLDEKFYIDILDTMEPKRTVPSDGYKYFNPEILFIDEVYYIRIDFDSNNDNFNDIKYKKGTSSTDRDFILLKDENNDIDFHLKLVGEESNRVDSKAEILVRDGSLYIPLRSRLEDGLEYELIYNDDYFIDEAIKKDLLDSKKLYEKVKGLNDSIGKIKDEIKEIDKLLENENLTNGEVTNLKNTRKNKEKTLLKLNKELKELNKEGEDPNILEGLLQDAYLKNKSDIGTKLTNLKRKLSFKLNSNPTVRKQYEGFVPEDYSAAYPILLEGKDFNHNMEVEFYGDGRYYSSDEVRVERDKAYVYLPTRRKLRPGMYDIILRNLNDYETELKYGVLSVVESGDFIPNEDYFVKDKALEGRVISLRTSSEDVLELKSRYADRSFLEIDLDQVLGHESWTKTIDFSDYLRANVLELKLRSSLFNVDIRDLKGLAYNRDEGLKISVGRARPYVVETFKGKLRNYDIKSDFIEIRSEEGRGSSYRLEIPFENSNGNNLKILRYDEDLRVFEEISTNVNLIDGLVEGFSLEEGIFVVVE